MRISYFNPFILKVIGCLISLQLLIALPSHAQQGVEIRVDDLSDLKISTTGPDLERMLDLSTRIMMHTPFYNLINNEFGPSLQGTTNTKQRLTETKITYLLSHTQEYWDEIEDYLKKFPKEKVNEPELLEARTKFHNLFDKVIHNLKLKELLSSKDALTKPLIIVDKDTNLSFEKISGEFNHPGEMVDGNNQKKTLPATDFVKLFIHVIRMAEKGDRLYFNVYDANIIEMADELIAAHRRGVEILGGLDKKVVESNEAAKAFYKKLLDAGINIVLVDSVGLNHQKLVALIKKNGTSIAVEDSGNFTHSCIDLKGDLYQIPDKDRPRTSIPNPNNLIYTEGIIPAVVVASEIRKNLIYKPRGQNQFPLGGMYLFDGPQRKGYRFKEWQALTFSPNGGLGDVMKLIAQINHQAPPSRIKISAFSLSSKIVGTEIVNKIVETIHAFKKASLPVNDVFQAIIDGRFAIRDFSILMKMAGYVRVEYDPNNPDQMLGDKDELAKDPEGRISPPKRNTVVAYIQDLDNEYASEIRKAFNNAAEWETFRHSIRTTPASFNTTAFEYNGKSYTYEVKNHHKLEILTDSFLTSMGTSVNFSEAGESNQEQISFVYSEYLTKKAGYYFDYLFNTISNKNLSIPNEAERRNRYLTKEQLKMATELYERKKQQEQKNKTSEVTEASRGLSCPAVFK